MDLKMSKTKDSADPYKKPLFIVTGPSGAGKTTFLQQLIKDPLLNQHFGFVPSHTTRPPRDREIDGIDYHFVRQEDFQPNRLWVPQFLETAEVYGNYYGTSVTAVLAVTQQLAIKTMDIQGAASVLGVNSAEILPLIVYIDASTSVLRTRLISRGEADWENRLAAVMDERKQYMGLVRHYGSEC
jgi:guanylate kinase